MSVAKPFPMKGCETPVFNKLRANDAIGFVFDCPQKTFTLSGLPKTSMDLLNKMKELLKQCLCPGEPS